MTLDLDLDVGCRIERSPNEMNHGKRDSDVIRDLVISGYISKNSLLASHFPTLQRIFSSGESPFTS